MILKYLFYLFLFLLPIQTVYFLRESFIDGMKWEYGVIGIYAIDILLVVIFGIFLFQRFQNYLLKNYELRVTSYEKVALSLFLLWSGLSIFWAPDAMLALYFFAKLLLAVGLFFVVRLIEIDMKKVVFVLLVAGVLQSGIGVAQFLYQYSPASSILGMSAHDASVAGSSVLKIDSGRFLRAYGTFPHPNILGGFLGVILMLGISYSLFRIEERKRNQEIAFLVGLVVILLGLILTFSRVAWLGVAFGVIALAIHINFSNVTREQRSRFRVTFFQMVGVLGMAGVVFVGILHEQVFPRFDTATIEHEGSVSERITSLQDARVLLNDHPFIGVGAGNFTAGIIEKGEKGLMGERGGETVKGEMGSRPVWSIQPVHNVFILIWSELGLIGIVLFVLFLFFILKSSITNHNSAILIAIFPSLFLDHLLWSSHFGLLFFFLLLGLASRKQLTE
jgi:O-antigen ligase